MGRIKITALPETGSLLPTDLLTAVANSANYKVTVQSIASSMPEVSQSISASYAATASSAEGFLVRQDLTASNANILGTITAERMVVQQITSSVIIYSTGSNIFGDELSDSQQLTGSVTITGSLSLADGVASLTASQALSASFVTASRVYGPYGSSSILSASNAVTSSHALNGGVTSLIAVSPIAISSAKGDVTISYLGGGGAFPFTGSAQITASLGLEALGVTGSISVIQGGFTGSLQGTASYVTGALFDSNNLALSASYAISASRTVTSSYAFTSSYVNPLFQNVLITGSLTISGSNDIDLAVIGNTLITGSLVVSGANGAGVFSQGATLIDYVSGISNSGSYMVWRAPFPCSVVALYGYREAGGASQINAVRSGSSGESLLTASNLVLTAPNVWSASNSVENTTFSSGDTLKLIMSGSSSNNQLAVQVDFIRKF